MKEGNPFPPTNIPGSIRIKPEEYKRLADLGAPLVDRPSDVVRYLLDFFDAHVDTEDYVERRLILECFAETKDGIRIGMPEA